MAQIGIAGAGIGGLAATAGLAQAGHDVTVFDAYARALPVGSGLVVQPVGLSVLDDLGAGDAARALGQRITRMAGFDAGTGHPALDVTYDPEGRARDGLAMHRAALHGVLLAAAQAAGVTFELGARITGRDGPRLLVEGMATRAFDLLVDAMGAGSPLSPMVSRPLPYGAIWGTVDWPEDTDLPVDQLRQCYRRASNMIGVLPIGRSQPGGARQAAVFWSMPRDDHAAWCATPLADWRAEAQALWPAIAPFIAQIEDHDAMTMARYSHGTLRRPYADGIVHIGDAWHRTSPQLGQGANMALLDARALVDAVDEGPAGEAGQRMHNARRLHVTAYQTFSAAFTPMYQSDSHVLPWVRDRILYPASQLWPATRLLPRLVRGDVVPPVLAGLGPR